MEYATFDMDRGDVEKFLRYAYAMEEVLRAALDDLPTDARQAEVALSLALRRIEKCRALGEQLSELAKKLAPIAKACEWRVSGDYGDDSVVEAALKWLDEVTT